MTPATAEPVLIRTVCGIPELARHAGADVTHVLSLLDPGTAEPEAFASFGAHRRLTLEFHDVIEPAPGRVPPEEAHVEAILGFGRDIGPEGHLLIHCHYGVSRSTAAMTMLLAQAHPEMDEDEALGRVLEIRPLAWPNTRMMAMADAALGRGGRLAAAARRLHAKQLATQARVGDYLRSYGRGAEVDAALALNEASGAAAAAELRQDFVRFFDDLVRRRASAA